MTKKWIRKLWFRIWRWYVYAQMDVREISPLIRFPFTLWVEIEAEKILMERGSDAMLEAAAIKLDEIEEGWKAFADILNGVEPPQILPQRDYRPGIEYAAKMMGIGLTEEDIAAIEQSVDQFWNYEDAEAVAISRYLREKNETVSDPG